MMRNNNNNNNVLDSLYTTCQTFIKVEDFHSSYSVETNPLGRGKCAVVRRCTEKASGRDFAAKFLKKRRRGKDCRAEIIHEIAVLELTKSNSRFVDLYEVYETSHEMILVLEYAAGGELFYICSPDKNCNISERQTSRLVRQIIEGVSFLHQNNVVHLDLKLQNLLLSSLEPLGDIRIVDFGMSRKISSNVELREIMGTTEYLAPEILNYEPITTATDMWSIGVICYMLLTGMSPFAGEDNQETYLNISQNKVDYSEETFAFVSQNAVDFLKSLLVKNPLHRATAEDCLAHPWLHLVHPHLSSQNSLQEKQVACNSLKCKCTGRRLSKDYMEDKENILENSGTAIKRFRYDDQHLKHYI